MLKEEKQNITFVDLIRLIPLLYELHTTVNIYFT